MGNWSWYFIILELSQRIMGSRMNEAAEWKVLSVDLDCFINSTQNACKRKCSLWPTEICICCDWSDTTTKSRRLRTVSFMVPITNGPICKCKILAAPYENVFTIPQNIFLNIILLVNVKVIVHPQIKNWIFKKQWQYFMCAKHII